MDEFAIKQDINFLDKPLWFCNEKVDKNDRFVWTDIEGYEYRSAYKLPDKVDILILLFLLYKSQENRYQPKLNLSRYEILRSCGLPHNAPHYYERLADSLERWSSIYISFKGTFYDGGKYSSKYFHIMKASINKVTKKVEVVFDEDWLLVIRESSYYKYINFYRYKALRRPVSRRLFEILCPKFLSRNSWTIKLTKLGKKLTLAGRTKKDGTEVIYASDVLVAVKPAVNEINKLASDIDLAEKAGIPAKDLFTITYEIKGEKQERVMIFYCHPVIIEEPKKTNKKEISHDLESIFLLLKKRTNKLEKVITNYAKKHGVEYVRWNILYSNKTAKKNYSSYLQKALVKNWAEEWATEEKERLVKENKREQEYESKQQQKREEEEQKKIAKRQERIRKIKYAVNMT